MTKINGDELRRLAATGASDAEIATVFDCTRGAVLRARARFEVPNMWEQRPSAPHGTANRYKSGCRCNECRNANRVYCNHVRLSRKATQ